MNSGCALQISRRAAPEVESQRETKAAPGTVQRVATLASVPILVLFVLLALIMCLSTGNKQASNNTENSD